MKIVLAAINAKYIHSNLALYDLYAYAKEYKKNIELAEYTINNQPDLILGDIFKRKPDVLALSCYIWNIKIIDELLPELKKVMPNLAVWLGGPEVSYNIHSGMLKKHYVDGIMIGEGEKTFLEVTKHYVEHEPELNDIRGIAYKYNNEILINENRKPMSLDEVPFPYDDLKQFENKIIYYETSRGCPYHCSYCLSSIERGVRFRSMKLVEKELQFFLDQKVPQVKFIDRTFNCNHDHAMAIWNYIYEHDNQVTNFHFEISADILKEDEIAILNKMRPGCVQLEIGVQTTNEWTIHAINRKMDFHILSDKVRAINKGMNIHQHLDLIAGLPGEDYKSFGHSFDDVYRLQPDQLQLGFLKVLKGAPIFTQAEKQTIVYRQHAPYEVLCTSWLPFSDMLKLKQVEDMVEVYYNSGQFRYTVRFLEHFFESPFKLYERLGEYYEKNGLFAINHNRMARYDILLDFYYIVIQCQEEDDERLKAFKEIMVYDLFLRDNCKSRPSFAKDYGIHKKEYRNLYGNEKWIEENLKEYESYSAKVVARITHAEYFETNIEKTVSTGKVCIWPHIVVFDYKNRNPLNYQARTLVVTDVNIS